MNNLLTGFANFQLPEWLTFGNAIAALISLIGLITALIKLRSAKKSDNTIFSKVSKFLEKNIETLTKITTVVNTFQTNIDIAITKVSDVVKAVDEQMTRINNLASFVFECFSLSNLSDENKLKLKVLYDRLFYKTDTKLIEELQEAKATADSAIVAKDELIASLTNKLSDATETLQNLSSAVKKTRRISN